MGSAAGLASAVGRITVDDEGDVRVLRLVGEIDDSAITAYEEAGSSGATTAVGVVDFAEVTYFSSAGVSFLLRQTKSARDQGDPPILRGLVDPARRILTLTGVTPLFHVTP